MSIFMAALPGLLEAGTSLLGGLFGRGSEKRAFKRQQQLAEQQYALAERYRMTPAKVRDEALEAGFNPITVLGAGGLQTGVSPAIPTLTSNNAMQQAMSGVGRGLARAVSGPIEAETRRLENDLLRVQIRAAQNQLDKSTAQQTAFNAARTRNVTTSPVRRGTAPLARRNDRAGAVNLNRDPGGGSWSESPRGRSRAADGRPTPPPGGIPVVEEGREMLQWDYNPRTNSWQLVSNAEEWDELLTNWWRRGPSTYVVDMEDLNMRRLWESGPGRVYSMLSSGLQALPRYGAAVDRYIARGRVINRRNRRRVEEALPDARWLNSPPRGRN